jgi:RNA polymerase sigma-70 factor (ECF subfamily)
MQNKSDEQLVADYLKGDEDALKLLIRQYLKPVYYFVYRYVNNVAEAEDVTQDVFIRMWRNAEKFDGRKNFKTWLFSIAKNASIDYFRKSRLVSGGKKTLVFSDFMNEEGGNVIEDGIIDPSPLPDEVFERAGTASVLTEAREKLSPSYQAVISKRHNDNLTFREISESFNEPLNTIKSRYRRALIEFKRILGGSL